MPFVTYMVVHESEFSAGVGNKGTCFSSGESKSQEGKEGQLHSDRMLSRNHINSAL